MILTPYIENVQGQLEALKREKKLFIVWCVQKIQYLSVIHVAANDNYKGHVWDINVA